MQNREALLDALRTAVLAGEESGLAEGDVIDEVREHIRGRALAIGAMEPAPVHMLPEMQVFEDS
jgi:hypothetical protein